MLLNFLMSVIWYKYYLFVELIDYFVLFLGIVFLVFVFGVVVFIYNFCLGVMLNFNFISVMV